MMWRGRGDLISMAAIVGGAALGGWLNLSRSPEPLEAPGVSTTAAPAPAPSSGAAAVEERGVAFRATSLGQGQALEGDYGGRLTREGSDLVVRLPVAEIQASWDADGEEKLVGLRLALADSVDGRWTLVRSGPLVPVDRTFLPGSDLWLRDLTLALPNVSLDEMDGGRWLVVVQETLERTDDGWIKAWSYAQDEPSTILRLMGWYLDGC